MFTNSFYNVGSPGRVSHARALRTFIQQMSQPNAADSLAFWHPKHIWRLDSKQKKINHDKDVEGLSWSNRERVEREIMRRSSLQKLIPSLCQKQEPFWPKWPALGAKAFHILIPRGKANLWPLACFPGPLSQCEGTWLHTVKTEANGPG